jgi:hypothetical protein
MSSGYLDWDSRFFGGVPFLDGVDWTAHGIPLEMTWEDSPDAETFTIPTASGESVLQSPIADDAVSDSPSLYTFQLPFQLHDENVYRRLMMARAKGTALQFVPHLWCMEHFAAQSIADVRSLARPVAWGVAAGVSSGTHPAVFYKNGTVDADCAALSGTLSQVLTVAEAGDIAVWYMPVFYVVVRGVSGQFQDVGGVMTNVTLEEVRRFA